MQPNSRHREESYKKYTADMSMFASTFLSNKMRIFLKENHQKQMSFKSSINFLQNLQYILS